MEIPTISENYGIDHKALTVLNAEMSACSICAEQGFTAITRPIDRGQGQQQIMVIGQAPGLHEGTRQVAFGGPAGRTLMRWFGTVGWSEEQVRCYTYLSAITKCYPGRTPKGGGDRNPSLTERANCRPYLLRELLAVRPKIVILIGSTAIKEVYGDKLKLENIIGTSQPMTLGELYTRLQTRLIKSKRLQMAELPSLPDVDWQMPLEVFHLPHPSGASTWLNEPQNKALLYQSLNLLGQAINRP